MIITGNQRSAIEASGNVLVMAGAGSGKTSTLVERCLYHVLHPKEPVSVVEMLIVTFTEAAAAEVRRRIVERLESARSEADGGVAARLEREIALIESAHISTLHSFCLQLVREHFQELGLDPSMLVFRDEQAAMFKQTALDRVMGRHFEFATKDAERVLELIETYVSGDDDRIRRLIVKLHNYTQTLAHPGNWFAEQIISLQKPEPRLWREWLSEALASWCDRWAPELKRLAGNSFAAQFCSRVAAVRGAAPAQFFSLFEEIAAAIDPTPRGLGPHREAIDEFFEEAAFLKSLLADGGSDPLAEDWEWTRSQMETLLRLTQEFSSEYARLKRDHASLDFHDLEQFALDLLLGKERAGPTKVAFDCRRKFQLVFVDEYQDINAAQDAILQAVAREGNQANRFLVGDVKQSIYRFRLAAPRIFQDYSAAWRQQSAAGRVIPLSENFRSPAPLLDFVNAVFGTLMRPELGGVEYDADSHLKAGESDRPRPTQPCVELHLHLTQKQAAEEEDEENATETELEARLVARRLRDLHDSGHLVWDRTDKELRPAGWSDMVVLLRSPRGRAEIYLKEFAKAGVPLQAERGGLYDSSDVSDLLCLLQLLDNPLQDVPLLAVLRSPLVGLSLDELALIRAELPKGLFWTALKRWHHVRQGKSDAGEAWRKVDVFLERFARWRKMGRHSALSDRIEGVINETQYLAWLLTQSRPAQRQANVRRFVALAGQFDPMQRQGLQRFLRFVDAQRDAEGDREPESMEAIDAVRLLSIHKSKGLEFPVVAVAGLGTRFNLEELRESILLDEQYGLCAQVKPPGCGASYPSLPWWLAKRRQRREVIGEELRLLYVALTRPRDTLLLFGTANRKTAEEKWAEVTLNSTAIEKASSPIAWLGPWCAQQIGAHWPAVKEGTTELFRWRIYGNGDLRAATRVADKPPVSNAKLDAARLTEVVQRLNWKYPWPESTRERAKLSVTALREANEEAAVRFQGRPVFRNRRSRSKLTASEIGTAHHLFVQSIDLSDAGNIDHLRVQAMTLLDERVLVSEQARALDLAAVAAFWNSAVGQSILSQADAVHREIPFSVRFTNADFTDARIEATLPEGEFVVVQGTIDLAVICKDEMWILDFKTDTLKESNVKTAVANYAPQLRLYGSALSRIYKRPVTKRWLHFLSLSRTVDV
jgi:ATP-dependent helicase/nuclease subunit A